MPFKRCSRCGKDFLADEDSQTLCSTSCSGPKGSEAAQPEKKERWWIFPLFFIFCCILTVFCYVHSFDVELYLVRNLPFMRQLMANKLAKSVPESLDHLIDGIADGDIDVAIVCLESLVENVDSVSPDDPLFQDLVDELKSIYDEEQDIDLKQAAIAAMGVVQNDEIGAVLYRALSDRKLARGAAIAMQKVGSIKAITPLIDIVLDENRRYSTGDTRFQAVRALGLIKDEDARAMPALSKTFSDPSGPIRDEVLTAMHNIGKQWKKLGISGRERVRAAIKLLSRQGKTDRIYAIRQHRGEVLADLKKIMH